MDDELTSLSTPEAYAHLKEMWQAHVSFRDVKAKVGEIRVRLTVDPWAISRSDYEHLAYIEQQIRDTRRVLAANEEPARSGIYSRQIVFPPIRNWDFMLDVLEDDVRFIRSHIAQVRIIMQSRL